MLLELLLSTHTRERERERDLLERERNFKMFKTGKIVAR
jgi:hypothetical protein